MLNEARATIPRSAALVVVADNIVDGRVGVGEKVAPGLVGSEVEEYVDAVDVARVQTNGVPGLRGRVTVLQELFGICGGPAISLAR